MSNLLDVAQEKGIHLLISRKSRATVREKHQNKKHPNKWQVSFSGKVLGEFPTRDEAIERVCELGFGEYQIKRYSWQRWTLVTRQEAPKNWYNIYKKRKYDFIP